MARKAVCTELWYGNWRIQELHRYGVWMLYIGNRPHIRVIEKVGDEIKEDHVSTLLTVSLAVPVGNTI